MFGSRGPLKVVVAGLLLLNSALTQARRVCPTDEEWVTVWGTMPQLTEPHNLPPAPFVCSSWLDRVQTLTTCDRTRPAESSTTQPSVKR